MTYEISWSLHRYGMSAVENERKIRVLLRKNYCVNSIRGGLKSEKVRANAIDILEYSIIMIKLQLTSMCYNYTIYFLVEIFFFVLRIHMKTKNDSLYFSLHAKKR